MTPDPIALPPRPERHRWLFNTLVVIAILAVIAVAIAFVLTTRAFSARFATNEAREATRNAATASARGFDQAQSTARIRLQACGLANEQAEAGIVGDVRAELALLRHLVRARILMVPDTPTARSEGLDGIIAFITEQRDAHPPRTCTPAGLDAYYRSCPGTTDAQLKRQRIPSCPASQLPTTTVGAIP